MPLINVAQILDSLGGAKKEGGGYALSEELDGNAFINLGQEVLQIPRLARLELQAELLVISTHKGERFFFPPSQLVGLRFGPAATKASRPAAGFSA
jgi:hypothetical protein